LVLALGVLVGGCAPAVKGMEPRGGAAETASWPPPADALQASSDAMSALASVRERQTARSYRNEQLHLELEGERAYVAPERRWERVTAKSGGEVIVGETVQVATRFYKRIGETASWQKQDWIDHYGWPMAEYRFPEAVNPTWLGAGEADGRAARILTFQHSGNNERRNAGWEFQTRLWLDPQTGHILQRQTSGSHKAEGAGGMTQRFEGTWTFLDHNGSIAVNEPAAATP